MDTIFAIVIIVVAVAYLLKRRFTGRNSGKGSATCGCSGCDCTSCGGRGVDGDSQSPFKRK
nr:FeoB-associated Cys-rich membrane protein [uncultured Pseudodesulfovibrio sp.]